MLNNDIIEYISSFFVRHIYNNEGTLHFKKDEDVVYFNQCTKKILGIAHDIKSEDFFLIKNTEAYYVFVKYINVIRYEYQPPTYSICYHDVLLYYYDKQQQKITHIDFCYMASTITQCFMKSVVTHNLSKKFLEAFFRFNEFDGFYLKQICRIDAMTKKITYLDDYIDHKFRVGDVHGEFSYGDHMNHKKWVIKNSFNTKQFLKYFSDGTIKNCEKFIIHNVDYCERAIMNANKYYHAKILELMTTN